MEHLDDQQHEENTPQESNDSTIQPAENTENTSDDLSFKNRIDLTELKEGIALIKGEVSKVIVI